MAMSDEEVREFANELNERIEKSLEENYKKRILVSARNLKNHCNSTNCKKCFFFAENENRRCALEEVPFYWKNKEIGEVDDE